MIKIFRIKAVLKWSILVTGLIFLNMNFFLAEVSVLGLDKDRNMAKNIAKLIAASSSEEEKDIFGGETKDILEVDLLSSDCLGNGSFYLLPHQVTFQTRNDAKPIVGNLETVIQPPEVI